jgi:nucleotide-binding universal stress UspA family protein
VEEETDMNVLLAIDESPCSDMAVDTVISQFPPAGTEMHVLNVIDWLNEVPISLAFAQGPAAADHAIALHNETRKHSRELVDRAVGRLRASGFRAAGHSVEGDPAQMILDAASEWSADRIVVGCHGRKGMDRMLIGSVAEHLLRHATCAVEVVRPAATKA